MEKIVHPFPPLYDSTSRVLILGSFPSVKSREQLFFYGHRQNRFWKVMGRVLGEKTPETIEEKRAMLLTHHVAVWDVIYSCRIEGSADSSIKDVVPTDLGEIFKRADIQAVYANGNKAYELYQKYQYPLCKREAVKLPSTSPANAAYSLDSLEEHWKQIRESLIVTG